MTKYTVRNVPDFILTGMRYIFSTTIFFMAIFIATNLIANDPKKPLLPKADPRLNNSIIQKTLGIVLDPKEIRLFETSIKAVADKLEEERKLENLQDVYLYYTVNKKWVIEPEKGKIVKSGYPEKVYGTTVSCNLNNRTVSVCTFPVQMWRDGRFNVLTKQAVFIEELVHHFWNERDEKSIMKGKVTEILNKIYPEHNFKLEDVLNIEWGGLNFPRLEEIGDNLEQQTL